jgi:glycosyltransferase involved in cell wall biosynthesis
MEGSIRICLISFLFWPKVGGTEVQTEKQARLLQALGHDVVVVTLRYDKRLKRAETLDGLPVVRVGGIYKRGGALRLGRFGHVPIDIGMFLELWRLRHRYDVIHIFQISPLAAVAAVIGKLAHRPVVISIQSSGPSESQRTQLEEGATLMADTLVDPSFLKIDFMDWASTSGDITYLPQTSFGGHAMLNFLRKSDVCYQILSNRSRSYLTSRGFRPEQIVRIPNGIDTKKFRPAPALRPDPTKPERDIICVARMDYAKGVDVLLHAWGRMMRAPIEWRGNLKPRLRLVGEGIFMPQMQRIAEELGIQDSVEFLGLRTDVVDLLQRSWGFVLPSRWEGMPNALLEAMACGLPCVATRVSGSEDIISDGVNGLLVEPEQPAEMALALRHIIEDTNLAQQLGQEGCATVVRDYQLATVVEQCLELYRRLLTKGKSVLPFALEGRGTGE